MADQEPRIVTSEEPDAAKILADMNLKELSLTLEVLWTEWKELDDYMTGLGYPLIDDDGYHTMKSRVEAAISERTTEQN